MAGNENSGRKTKAEEKKAAIKEITEAALLELAKSKVKRYLDKDLSFNQTKEMALPIVVKGMAQKLGNDPENPLPVIPIYAGLSKHNSDTQDIQSNQED